MKKVLKPILIIFSILFVLWSLVRVTNIFNSYKSPTIANEPTLKSGERFFASNLVKPQKLNLICFYYNSPNSIKQLTSFRLCGEEGDIIEIRNRDLYVNNIDSDKGINLKHIYNIARTDYEKLRYATDIDQEMIVKRNVDTFAICLEDKFVLENKINALRNILSKTNVDPSIYSCYSKNWNQDNFGPIKVPKDKFFVLGDNRYNALDSRYIGFIDKNNYVATVIWKK